MIVRKRLHQAGLADPRLATDEHNGPGASPRFHERRIQHLEIRRALEQVHAVIVPQYSGCFRVRRGAGPLWGPLRRLPIVPVARPGRFAYGACPRTIARHQTGPLLAERLAYLAHCAEQGRTQSSLRLIAQHLLVFVDYLPLTTDDEISIEHYETSRTIAQKWQTEKFRERFGKPLSERGFP